MITGEQSLIGGFRLRIVNAKQAAQSLNVAITKTTQCKVPAFRKVAACMLDWPAEAAAELAINMAEIKAERERNRQT